MLKHEEMIENVHRRIAQYEEEKNMKHSKIKNIISAIKPNTKKEEIKVNEDGFIEVASGTERINSTHRILRIVSTAAACAVFITAISATGILLHKNSSPKHAVDTESDINETEETTDTSETEEMSSQPQVIESAGPFTELLNSEFNLSFPNIELSNNMRTEIKSVFNSVEEWKTASTFNHVIHYDNRNISTSVEERISFVTEDYSLRIFDDNIIEFAKKESLGWQKSFYECDSTSLINSIDEIIEKEIEDNGVDFDDDVSDFKIYVSPEESKELSDNQKTILRLYMKASKWTEIPSVESEEYALTLENVNKGNLYIKTNSINSSYQNSGAAYYVSADGITYSCENINICNDLQYVMASYDYPNLECTMQIVKCGDYLTLVDTDDRELIEQFVYSDVASMLQTTDEDYSDTNPWAAYKIYIHYSTDKTDIIDETISLSRNYTERIDRVLDPITNLYSSHTKYYNIDMNAFEAKLAEVFPEDVQATEPTTLTDQAVEDGFNDAHGKNNNPEQESMDSASNDNNNGTTDSESKTNNSSENKKTKPVETIKRIEDIDRLGRPIVVITKNDKVIASSNTHDHEQLAAMVENQFIPSLTETEMTGGGFNHGGDCYEIGRIYEHKDKMFREFYWIGSDGYVDMLAYDITNPYNYIPAGAVAYKINMDEFAPMIEECIKNSAY